MLINQQKYVSPGKQELVLFLT